MDALPDFGRHLGVDGKALSSHSMGSQGKQMGKTSDPDADWGKHETGGTGKNGKAWSKVKTWFGYGLHLSADTRHEIPLAFAVSQASAAEQPVLSRLLAQLAGQEPKLLKRCRDFSADRGYDSQEEAVGGISGPSADGYACNRSVVPVRGGSQGLPNGD